MDRRKFVKVSSAGSAGMSFFPYQSFGNQFFNSKEDSQALTVEIHLNPNGSFHIKAGVLALNNCYPAFDFSSLKPIQLDVDNGSGTIRYSLADGGYLLLSFKSNNQALTINTLVGGLNRLPGYIYPIAGAQVQGADRFFKQGLGFAGPSGILPLPVSKDRIEEAKLKEESWSYDSYLMAGLLSQSNECMGLATLDHNQYLFRSNYYNQQLRFGLIDRHLHEEERMFRAGFQTENINVDGEINLPEIVIKAGNQPFQLFHGLAKDISAYYNIKLKHTPRYYYCSWYDKEHEFSQDDLNALLSSLKKNGEPTSDTGHTN